MVSGTNWTNVIHFYKDRNEPSIAGIFSQFVAFAAGG